MQLAALPQTRPALHVVPPQHPWPRSPQSRSPAVPVQPAPARAATRVQTAGKGSRRPGRGRRRRGRRNRAARSPSRIARPEDCGGGPPAGPATADADPTPARSTEITRQSDASGEMHSLQNRHSALFNKFPSRVCRSRAPHLLTRGLAAEAPMLRALPPAIGAARDVPTTALDSRSTSSSPVQAGVEEAWMLRAQPRMRHSHRTSSATRKSCDVRSRASTDVVSGRASRSLDAAHEISGRESAARSRVHAVRTPQRSGVESHSEP